MARTSYPHTEVERKAQEKWEALGLHTTDLASAKEPYFVLTEFPYPSGDLHVGHWHAFAIPDMFARLKRMQGKNVLYPIGFDAFGLPAENAAIQRKLDPRKWTEENMTRMREQLKRMGASFDWSREVVTASPDYYKWTQWLFCKFYEQGLAYRGEAAVKWCPNDQTVLANEQVIDGHCERCGHEVEEKRLTQWFFKITGYAERLLEDLETLPWPTEIKDAQRAWIGKSDGARLPFRLSTGQQVNVFTTRPDTLYGATYLVLAPEHQLVEELLGAVANADDVRSYREQTSRKTERERSENKEKTGIRIEGVTATNPATKEEIPVYVADYVLASYGTGAVMAVPAHDERDFEFANKHGLPIRQVIMPHAIDAVNPHVPDREIVRRKGIIAIVRNPKDDTYLSLKWSHDNWTTFVTGGVDEGEDTVEAAIREIREETGYKNVRFVNSLGESQSEFYASHKQHNRVAHTTTLLFELVNEDLDDTAPEEQARHSVHWLSKEEIEIRGMRHAEFDLIWKRVLSGMDAYTGPGILTNSGPHNGRESEEVKWEITEAAGGTRETQYRIRDWLVSRQRYWGAPIPVVYDPEGKPHLVPSEHLPWLLPTDVDFTPSAAASPLASSQELRERVTSLFGEGWTPEFDTFDTFVDSSWYYTRYLAPHDTERFSDPELMEKWLPVDRYSGGSEHTTMHLLYARFFHKALYDLALVPTPEPFNERFNRGLIMGTDGQKMSKRWGNVVNPDEQVDRYGADSVRLYLAFIGPYNEPGHYPWKPEGLTSMRRFLDRIYALLERASEAPQTDAELRALAKAGHKVAADLERFKTNTAVSALMVLVNALEELDSISRNTSRDLAAMLAPFAPHLAEHLFETLGGEGSVHELPWPTYDPKHLETETMTIAVQVAGKKRGEIVLAPDADEGEALKAALALPKVLEALPSGRPGRVIYVPGRILNLVP